MNGNDGECFEKRVMPEPMSGCHLWLGALAHFGYGIFYYSKNGVRLSDRAHRVAWVMIHGPIPIGLNVLHKCDTPSCVNSDHLFLGTHSDNVADMVRKGRQARGKDHGLKVGGENHSKAKLSAAQVIKIREEYEPEVTTCGTLARKYGVTRQSIFDIIARKTWREVT